MSMPQERWLAALFFDTEPDHSLSVHPPLVLVVVYTFLARLVLASVSSCAKMR
jgi:hypothetical protein